MNTRNNKTKKELDKKSIHQIAAPPQYIFAILVTLQTIIVFKCGEEQH